MKKSVYLKFQYIITIVLFCLSTIYSCKDDSISNNNYNYHLITSISGVVNDLPDTSRLVKAIVQMEFINHTVDSNFANSNNSIVLNLSPPPSQYLFPIVGYFITDTTTILISDRSAKVNVLMLAAFYDSSGNFAGEIFKDNHFLYNSDSVGYFLVVPLYCDRKVSMSGSSIYIYNNKQDTSKSNFDINMNTGWNVLTSRIKVSRNGYREFDLFDGEPTGANYYFRNPNSVLFNQLKQSLK
ncbi:MAG: hypothetical protein ABIY50_12560 [Ignavibacteria bacterium]